SSWWTSTAVSWPRRRIPIPTRTASTTAPTPRPARRRRATDPSEAGEHVQCLVGNHTSAVVADQRGMRARQHPGVQWTEKVFRPSDHGIPARGDGVLCCDQAGPTLIGAGGLVSHAGRRTCGPHLLKADERVAGNGCEGVPRDETAQGRDDSLCD